MARLGSGTTEVEDATDRFGQRWHCSGTTRLTGGGDGVDPAVVGGTNTSGSDGRRERELRDVFCTIYYPSK